MDARVVGASNGIKDLESAKRFSQDFARTCYAEPDFDELREEPYKKGLVEKGLIDRGHHSPFDHFHINFYFKGVPKAVAMVLNNQRPCVTSEKSARYTVMESVDFLQKDLYNKWAGFFEEQINSNFPESKFPKLYIPGSDKKTPARKLSQENARYMTSVFTPTKMAHTLSLRQTNILMHWFDDFVGENLDSSDGFKKKLAESLDEFRNLEALRKWEIPNFEMKGRIGLRFFGGEVEEHFGQDVYSTNYDASFASLAQLHRHRLLHYHISDGWQSGAPMSFYVPPLVKVAGKESEWCEDLGAVAKNDFPQAQLLRIAERGNREDLAAKTEERICGFAQLETAKNVGSLVDEYSKYVSEVADLKKPSCLEDGCKKGNCYFGPSLALERLV